MALIRLLAQSIRDPVFQCLTPVTFPGFVEGANTVAIEQNGALRINGPGGASFHLPSWDYRIDTALSMAADGVVPTGGQSHSNGIVRVVVSADGRITDLVFGGTGCGAPGPSGG
jgi:hypothetical protein